MVKMDEGLENIPPGITIVIFLERHHAGIKKQSKTSGKARA
jgi:hypothetical protein